MKIYRKVSNAPVRVWKVQRWEIVNFRLGVKELCCFKRINVHRQFKIWKNSTAEEYGSIFIFHGHMEIYEKYHTALKELLHG